MKDNSYKLISWLKQNKWLGLFYLFILAIYVINTFHTNFPDEFDNIVGGWYINQGILPYTGFFSHHNPGAYYIASLITLFTKQSFVKFRVIWALVLFLVILGSFVGLTKRLNKPHSYFFLLYTYLLGVAATYFWGQMILSETIVGYTLVPAYTLVLIKSLRRQKFLFQDLVIISILTSIGLLTSLTYVFAIGILLTFLFFIWVKQVHLFSKATLKAIGIFILPYLLFLIYLIVTGSFAEFKFQSIDYNRDYYIYNFPLVAGQVSKNPARYALSILYNTTNQFIALATQVKDFNFAYPVNLTLLLGNAALILYLLSEKRYFLAGMIYLLLIYLNTRGEPLNSAETDFHSTVYIMISLLNLSFIFWTLVKEVNIEKLTTKKLLYQLLLVLVGIYGLFTTVYYSQSFATKAYTKFMGQMPGIYDRPVVAPIINQIVNKEEYFWIGPFEFQELLYINGRQPSKYHWFLPANERSEKIKSEITADLLANRPKLIVFKENFGVFGTSPADFNYPIVNILREHYFRLKDLDTKDKKYQAKIKGLHNFDIEENFYFDKQRQDEIVDLLLKQGIVELIQS